MYCIIIYELHGERKEWPIDAHPEKDNDETLKAHLKRWIPDAAYLGHQMGEIPNNPLNCDPHRKSRENDMEKYCALCGEEESNAS